MACPAPPPPSAVSRTQTAALVYNYLRSNGFVKAMKQFREEAHPLLAPFKNRIPTGVKGLDAVLNEYVRLQEREAARAAAMANNPLATRMYQAVDEFAGVTRAAAGGSTASPPLAGTTPTLASPSAAAAASPVTDAASPAPDGGVPSVPSRRAGSGAAPLRRILPAPPIPASSPSHGAAPPTTGGVDASSSRGAGGPSNARDRSSGALPVSPAGRLMPPPPARSPHRGKKRGSAPPRRHAAAGYTGGGHGCFAAPRGAHASLGPGIGAGAGAADGCAEADGVGHADAQKAVGSLDGPSADDVSNAAARGWQRFSLPAELSDAGVREKLAAQIAGFVSGDAGGSQSGGGGSVSDTTRGGAGFDVSDFEYNVDQLVDSLFQDDANELGQLLAPLLGAHATPEKEKGKRPGPARERAAGSPPGHRARQRLSFDENDGATGDRTGFARDEVGAAAGGKNRAEGSGADGGGEPAEAATISSRGGADSASAGVTRGAGDDSCSGSSKRRGAVLSDVSPSRPDGVPAGRAEVASASDDAPAVDAAEAAEASDDRKRRRRDGPEAGRTGDGEGEKDGDRKGKKGLPPEFQGVDLDGFLNTIEY